MSHRSVSDRLDAIEADADLMIEALTSGWRFLTAYREASTSDEEGLLMAVDPSEMRALWRKVDEAAEAFSSALLALKPKDADDA